MKREVVTGLLCGALLAGCVTAGVEVRPEQMANFRYGVTTLQDVIVALGPASVETALDDGSTLLVYTYVTSRPHPESYIPFIGSLVAGADTHSSAAVFLFDSHGLLKSANSTGSNVGTGMTAAHSAQPRASAPVSDAPVVGRGVPPPAVQTAQPTPEEDVAPASQMPGEPLEINVQPGPVE
ncbi:hypothetical protein E1N52_03065 [Paraburkholderia guartelaensis]|jgi:hypothetical protein|uniref:Outer membrane protein assembly factor BamE n=1 Tax=Paraburkholderia guartelaensis TaxID=2546446 RepID=A0A4R5LKS1_9BURK|nr:hypothetical protein [Paraburkholderia guartelaensis]TDG10347.1 hypothetical protein E1N52_03065 [Paraburkholderia guartelaensis]